MIRLFKLWLEKLVCKHKWEVHITVTLYDGDDKTKMPVGTRQTLICKECGKIKKITL